MDPGWLPSFGPGGPPAEGDDLAIVWRADLGGSLRVGDLAAHLEDLDLAVCVGERWGTELARVSARQTAQRLFMEQVRAEGPQSVWAGEDDFLDLVADTQLPDLVGSPMTLVQVQYRNPLEVVLEGSGFIVAGVMLILRLARDWSNTRRIGAGAAREAEAVARQTEARADLLQWLVDETKAGRMPVPPGDLLASVSHSDAATLQRLSTADVTLELPEDFDLGGGNETRPD